MSKVLARATGCGGFGRKVPKIRQLSGLVFSIATIESRVESFNALHTFRSQTAGASVPAIEQNQVVGLYSGLTFIG